MSFLSKKHGCNKINKNLFAYYKLIVVILLTSNLRGNNMLSPKQKFLDFIKNFISTNDRPPTFVEIMKGLKFSSLGTINWYIVELESEGLIKRVKGSNGKRALSILEKILIIGYQC